MHLQQVVCFELRLELLDENRRVVSRHAEAHHGTDVAEHGIADGIAHLRDILVGYGKIETILTSFRQNRREGIGSEVLELVHIEIEWSAVLDVRDVGPRHGGKLDFGDEEGSEDAGIVLSKKTFGQVDDEDFAFVHNLADIESRAWLSDDVTNDRVGREGTDFIENRRDGFCLEFLVPAGKLDVPELQHDSVLAV